MNELAPFFDKLAESFNNKTFVKITLSKPAYKSDGLLNVYIREIEIKGEDQLSFTFHYQTNDQVKNYSIKAAQAEINKLLDGKFKIATLFTLEEDFTIQLSKKGKVSTRATSASFKNKPPKEHDQPKTKRAKLGKYLSLLGVCDEQGKVIPKMADKFKQINKYLEIVEVQLKYIDTNKSLSIVDMGSGKGYLTFALYDYLVNQKKIDARIKGIEQRKELVDFCNKTAQKCGFENLHFKQQSIQEFNDKVDVLIALHACDTATDDAISRGIIANAQLIITAPCCHKQIRQQLKGKEQESPLLKYGIFKERQFEMVTDTIRSLLLEQNGYNTNIFEFISNEHTRKNVMLTGQKSHKKVDTQTISEKIEAIKKDYNIEYHYLEKILEV